MHVLLIIALLAVIADALSTITALGNGMKEAGPVMKYLVKWMKPNLAVLLTRAIVAGIAVAVYFSGNVFSMVVIAVAYLYVALSNVQHLREH